MAAYQYIYVMKGLTKIYPGGRKVLENIWLSFLPGAKIGVLGHNGAGKSTLLRIMAGLDKDISGEAWAADGVSVGFLQQEPQLDAAKDVLGNVMEGVGATAALLKEFEDVSNAMADPDADFDTLLAEQAELQEKIDHADAWDLQRKVEIAMDALRCPPGDADVSKLSGGERRRVALCRLLLPAPTCCCSTSRPTISTPNWSPGWSSSCRNTRARWSPSPTTATSSTTWPAGSSSSIAARASRARATTPAGWSRRASAWRRRRRPRRRASAPWSASWNGSGKARRRARPSARRASRPTRACWRSPTRRRWTPPPSRFPPARASATW